MLFLIVGPDTYRARQKLAALRQKYLSEVEASGVGLSRYDGPSLEVADIRHVVAGGSLLARRRFIVIENLFRTKRSDVIKALAERVREQASGGNIIVFYEEEPPRASHSFARWLARNARCQSFPLPSREGVQRFVTAELATRDRRATRGAITALLAQTKGDTWSIVHAIEKLDAYLPSGSVVDEATVAQLVSVNPDDDIFRLVDAVVRGDTAEAAVLVTDHLERGTPPELLTALLEQQLRVLLVLVAEGPAAAAAMGAHPYVVKKLTAVARGRERGHIQNAYLGLTEVDDAIKSGGVDPRTVLLSFVTRNFSARVS